jgi:hypothetical protein
MEHYFLQMIKDLGLKGQESLLVSHPKNLDSAPNDMIPCQKDQVVLEPPDVYHRRKKLLLSKSR